MYVMTSHEKGEGRMFDGKVEVYFDVNKQYYFTTMLRGEDGFLQFKDYVLVAKLEEKDFNCIGEYPYEDLYLEVYDYSSVGGVDTRTKYLLIGEAV